MRLTAIALGLVLGGTLSVTAEEAAAPGGPKSPGSEGIKVHGHWTIDIRNPDGTLASHHEFENKLALPGDPTYPAAGVGNRILAALLGRAATSGLWEIQLHGVFVELCADGSAPVTHGCIITEAGATSVGTNYFKNLTVTTDLQAGTVTLKGSARNQTGAGLTHVSTALRTCDNQVPPSTPCTSQQGGGNFTTAEAPPSLPPIAQNQIIEVTVVLSFS